MFILFGIWPFILKEFDLNNFINLTSYFILSVPLFFQLLFLNIITFIFILIFMGFKKFNLNFYSLFDIFIKHLIVILVNILLRSFCLNFSLWKNYIDNRNHSCRKILKFIIFFPCALISTIILFPQRIIINIIHIIIIFIYKMSFSGLIDQLDENFRAAFNYSIT